MYKNMKIICTDIKVIVIINLKTAGDNMIKDEESVTLWLRYNKFMILLSFCSTFYAGSIAV